MQVNQLQHELSKKDELLRIVSIASEESETDSSCSTPLRFNESFSLSQGLLQLDMLQEKLKELEEEKQSVGTMPELHKRPPAERKGKKKACVLHQNHLKFLIVF